MSLYRNLLAVLLLTFALTMAANEPRPDIEVPADTISAEQLYWLTANYPDYEPLTEFDLRTPVYSAYRNFTLSGFGSAPVLTGPVLDGHDYDIWRQRFHQRELLEQMRQDYMFAYPERVRYNEALLPEPPRKFHVEIDPQTARLSFVEDVKPLKIDEVPENVVNTELKKRHWLRNFTSALQVSQAYMSPNWYQGGNNNLAVLLALNYGVKLNQAFHPNLLAELTVDYRFNANGTPEDSLRNYSISQDLLQINGKFGFKAFRSWFYSLTATFKTQLFHGYDVNSPDIRSAFMSPGELNVGVGMTWDFTNEPKTLTFNASLSPLSWNMKTCLNKALDPTQFGMEEGHRVRHEFGSGAECKLSWKILSNITYTSRLFVFTDYTYAQGDWENTLSFNINRFLSTQLYVHVHYDSKTPRLEDSNWHLWQLKEILSFGFNYSFSTI